MDDIPGSRRFPRGLTGIILIGMAIRVWVAIHKTDIIWPDEQFQTLEPASTVVFGRGTLTWEWTQGYRPWIVPGFYIPLFAALKALGVMHGKSILLWARGYTAFVASTVMFGLATCLRIARVPARAIALSLVAYGFSTPMILWSCAPLARFDLFPSVQKSQLAQNV